MCHSNLPEARKVTRLLHTTRPLDDYWIRENTVQDPTRSNFSLKSIADRSRSLPTPPRGVRYIENLSLRALKCTTQSFTLRIPFRTEKISSVVARWQCDRQVALGWAVLIWVAQMMVVKVLHLQK